MATKSHDSKSTEVEPEVVEGLTPEQLAAEREPGSPDAETVVVNQQTLAAGEAPAKNYPASDAYVATITPPASEATVDSDKPVKVGKDWWVDGAGEAHLRESIAGVSIPSTAKVKATDRIRIRLTSGATFDVPVGDPQAAFAELTK